MLEAQIKNSPRKVIKMGDMEPCQIGVVIDKRYNTGHIVLRTAATSKFEVMSLTYTKPNSCWTSPEVDIEVELFPPGTVIELRVTYDNDGG